MYFWKFSIFDYFFSKTFLPRSLIFSSGLWGARVVLGLKIKLFPTNFLHSKVYSFIYRAEGGGWCFESRKAWNMIYLFFQKKTKSVSIYDGTW